MNGYPHASIRCPQNHDIIIIIPYITLTRENGVMWYHHAQALGSRGDVQTLQCQLKDNQPSSKMRNKKRPLNNVKANVEVCWDHLGTSSNSLTPNLIGSALHHTKVHMRVNYHVNHPIVQHSSLEQQCCIINIKITLWMGYNELWRVEEKEKAHLSRGLCEIFIYCCNWKLFF